ncbi:hypothetical protein GCM10011358_13790 [Sinisalibacter lacisalsi]|uniref:Uncharacterized protein n=1 Tax=Sinisalibacter lacisalsi TaxID=1526570 RepID=A0ABQ1QLL3_9RHOB|nr:hypothetical protein GCM10011358_13790 [Sinisalibacter lacisalsi]
MGPARHPTFRPPAPALDAALDLALWQAIDGGDNPALFEAYLAQFPAGTFRPIAQARLRALAGVTAAPARGPDNPQALYSTAMTQLDALFTRPPAEWNAAAREPIALLERATELARVGCYAGSVDGKWGRARRRPSSPSTSGWREPRPPTGRPVPRATRFAPPRDWSAGSIDFCRAPLASRVAAGIDSAQRRGGRVVEGARLERV